MSATASIILLYCIATFVAIASRRFRVPYTAALLVAGLALGSMHFATLPHLTKELLFAVFLPGLLFEAAYHLEGHELRDNARTIGALAVPGVIVAIMLTALLLVAGKTLVGSDALLDWKTALFFGCVIAATDPVAVTSIFRELKAPRRLHVLVESESLFNDGTSIVFLTLMLAYFAGASPTAWSLGVEFVRIAGGGALIGLAIGWAVSRVRIAIDDPVIEITLTTIAAYGSFVAAEQVHCSGVVATVVAGVVCGNAGRHHSMTATTREAVDSFWEWLAFALNSAVFLLLGAEVSLSVLAGEWKLILIGAVAALVARAVVVEVVALGVRGTSERVPRSWLPVLTWGGLRGALSLVLALSLPKEAGNTQLIVAMTAGTVVLSLIGQGATMPLLLRRLGLGGSVS